MYSRNGIGGENPTIIPGMNDGPRKKDSMEPNSSTSSSKPVIGFLFSVSRTGAGEYWPVHIGKNTIGRGQDCSIRLPEQTVSEHHAELFVRPLTSRLLAELKITEGITGGFVNDVEIEEKPLTCHNGDHIKIGKNYEFYLVLLDANELGLHVSEEFLLDEGPMNAIPTGGGDFDDPTAMLHDPSNRRTGGTVSMDGGAQFTEGFTQVL